MEIKNIVVSYLRSALAVGTASLNAREVTDTLQTLHNDDSVRDKDCIIYLDLLCKFGCLRSAKGKLCF